MTPLFVVITTGGVVYICANRADARAIGGTIIRVSSLPGKLQLATLSGAASPYTITPAAGISPLPTGFGDNTTEKEHK